jgi:adenylosuccinate synthase
MINPEFMVKEKSAAVCGGAFGDEGKGRIVDELVNRYAREGSVVVYGSNGGANAGHTVEFHDGRRVALHQLPSGVFSENATVVLGKGKVIHPGDLAEEIRQVREVSQGKIKAEILIDDLATLSLDTHRADEAVDKQWYDGGRGATGRGISPAYADILLRHPLQVRDLISFDEEKIRRHYCYYEAKLAGLNARLSEMEVPTLEGGTTQVGSIEEFVRRLRVQRDALAPYCSHVVDFVHDQWDNRDTAWVFEFSQAIGLDWRIGVYPDVTASDTTIRGVLYSAGIRPEEIRYRIGVIKATYMSSVGTRQLPTMMEGPLAEKIREDAHEYGATTRRPRGIAHLDLEALQYFAKMGDLNYLALTHMDICYPNTPVKVCVGYEKKLGGGRVQYEPDQVALNKVKPVYLEFNPWDGEAVRKATKPSELPKEAKEFLYFVSEFMNLPIFMVTTGPRREQGIIF